MYTVYENNIPCDCYHHAVHESWEQSSYKTYDEAIAYLINWLGCYNPGQRNLREHLRDYNEYKVSGVSFTIKWKD